MNTEISEGTVRSWANTRGYSIVKLRGAFRYHLIHNGTDEIVLNVRRVLQGDCCLPGGQADNVWPEDRAVDHRSKCTNVAAGGNLCSGRLREGRPPRPDRKHEIG
jgi:hypothetical protein